jgi:fibronectin-binding autotransporter adhesin
MKSTATLRAFLIGSTLLAGQFAHAVALTWDANAGTAGQTDGAGVWLTASQWWTGSANATWASTDNAIFGNGGAGGAVTLASATNVGSLSFNYFTSTYTLGTSGSEITLSNGITRNAGAGTVAFASAVKLGAAQTWANNSNTLYSVKGGIDLNGNALTIDGIGNTDLGDSTANIVTGAGGIIKNGTGSLIFSGAGTTPLHNFTGGVTLNAGAIRFQSGAFLLNGNTQITGGYLGGRSGSGVTWTDLGTGAGQIRITGGVSGFSGEGTSNSAFQIGSALSTLTWGDTNFNPSVLVLGAIGANNNGVGSLNNAIDLNGSNRTITSTQVTDGAAASGFTLSGAITNGTGTAGLTKTGVGNLRLVADNTYNGGTTISGGSITLATNGALSSTSALNLSGGGTLRLVNTAQLDRVADGTSITSNGGGISYENTNTAAITYTETLGSVSVGGGLLNVVQNTNQSTSNGQTLTFGTSGSSNLTQSGTGSVAFSALTTGPQASGNKNMFVVFGSGSTTAGQIVGPWATTGTAANAQTDYAVYSSDYVVPANITASAQSAWSASHAVTSNYTLANASGTTVDGRLTAAPNVNTLRNTTAAGGAITVDVGTDFVTLAGNGFADGDVVVLGSSAGGLYAGVPYFVRDNAGAGAGTFKVALASGGTAINITAVNTGTITGGLSLGANQLGTFGILNGSATPLVVGGSTGTVTLPTTSAGQLHVTTGSGGISINAPITNNTGALTLVKNGSGGALVLNGANTFTGDIAINAGTLQLGSNNIANNATLGTGSYAGNIFIGAGATLHVQSNANQTLSGVISGDGNLIKSYTGTLTLSGANTYTGKTSFAILNTNGTGASAGTLSVSSFNSVNGGTPLLASSSLGAPTTVANGTIEVSGSLQNSLTLRYTGNGETTDRILNFNFNGTGLRTLDASGPSGLLKFTSTPTSNGTATGHITLQGTGAGELVGGLPFAFTNFTKSDAGTWTLGGAVGSTGVITVNAGTLTLQKKSSLMGGLMSNWTAAKINVKSGATLALNVDSADAAGLSSTSLDTLLTNISVAGSATAGLQSGAKLGLDTSTATGGTFTQGNAIANSTGTNGGAIGVTKLGAGTLVFDKVNTYTGPTKVSAGTLSLVGGSQTSAITVDSGASLGFTLASPTTSTASVTLNGTVTILGSAPVSPTSYLLMTATSITGTPSLSPAISGYQLVIANSNTELRLEPTVSNTYADWLVLNAPATGFTTDTDNDGIPNGVENVLGSNPNTYNAGLTQISATATSVTYKHQLNPTIASDVTYSYEWSTDLTEWKASGQTNTGGTTATITPAGPVSGEVTVVVNITAGPSVKLFGRLVAMKP